MNATIILAFIWVSTSGKRSQEQDFFSSFCKNIFSSSLILASIVLAYIWYLLCILLFFLTLDNCSSETMKRPADITTVVMGTYSEKDNYYFNNYLLYYSISRGRLDLVVLKNQIAF